MIDKSGCFSPTLVTMGATIVLTLVSGCKSDDDDAATTSPPGDTSPTPEQVEPTDEPTEAPTPRPIPTPRPNELDELNWYPDNHDKLVQFVEENGLVVDPADPPSVSDMPVAVAEWENTSISGSMEAAFFRYQSQFLMFQLEPGLFETLIPTAAGAEYGDNEVTHLSADFGGISIADLAQDIIDDYYILYYQAETLGCVNPDEGSKADVCVPFDELKTTEEYLDFSAKMIFLYEALSTMEEVGPDYTCMWVAKFQGGYAKSAVEKMARDLFSAQNDATLELVSLTSPQRGRTGVVTATWMNGLRAIPEMADLFNYVRFAGFDLWLLTTASQYVATGAATETRSAYAVPEERIIGVQLEEGSKPEYILAPYFPRNMPYPYGEGKLVSISDKIGKDPMLVIGGTWADYEMLTAYVTQALQLVVNHNDGCPMSRLYAVAASGSTSQGDYLLQGIDENTGAFVTSQSTTSFGESSPATVPTTNPCQ